MTEIRLASGGGLREARSARLGRALFDRLEAANARSPRTPRRALAVAAALGTARGALSRRWPAPAEVAALFGVPAPAARRIALAVAANEARNRLILARTANRPLAPFAGLVRWRDRGAAAALGGGIVLVTAHVGAIHLQGAALDSIDFRRMVVRWSPLHEQGPEESNALIHGGLAARAAALRRAIATIEEGGSVVTTLDGGYGSATAGSVLGRPLGIGSGAFLIARMSGAPLVPFVTSWAGNEAVCDLGAPLSSVAEAARWLDAYLRAAPEQISLGLLRQLLFPPAVDPAVQDARRGNSAARQQPAQLQMP